MDYYDPRRRALRAVRQLLYPRECPFCGRVLGDVRDCPDCAVQLETLRRKPGIRLDPAQHYISNLAGAAAPYRYSGCVRRGILNAKYQGKPWRAVEIGNRLVQLAFGGELTVQYGELLPQPVPWAAIGYDLIVPVPASGKKRGYNVPELMALPLAKAMEVPLAPQALVRTRTKRHQAGLTKPGISRTSGVFLMNRESTDQRFMFADCAINIDPNAQELSEIALNTADTARIFDIDPKIAMLSFSTKGSAKAPQAEKVREATQLAKGRQPKLAIDGELQFDAAFVPSTAEVKAPDSDVAGQANVFIFPDLQSGNIGYKIAQRLGMFEAIGPILQGLNKPVNDLSRGSSAEDIYKLAIITAAQAVDDMNE